MDDDVRLCYSNNRHISIYITTKLQLTEKETPVKSIIAPESSSVPGAANVSDPKATASLGLKVRALF